ncbi:MAG: hypothetical protein ACR2KL_14515 [Nocardioidaceae bacterium]
MWAYGWVAVTVTAALVRLDQLRWALVLLFGGAVVLCLWLAAVLAAEPPTVPRRRAGQRPAARYDAQAQRIAAMLEDDRSSR